MAYKAKPMIGESPELERRTFFVASPVFWTVSPWIKFPEMALIRIWVFAAFTFTHTPVAADVCPITESPAAMLGDEDLRIENTFMFGAVKSLERALYAIDKPL